MPAGTGEPGAGIQPLDDLPDGHALLDQPAIEQSHQLGLGLLDHEIARHRLPARDVAVAVGGPPGQPAAGTRLLQLAAAKALAQHRPLVLGDGALDLQQELVVGVVRDRVVQEHHLAAGAAELLQEQHLVGILAGQAVRAEYGEDVDRGVADSVPQGVEPGAVETGAARALVAKNVLVGQLMPLLASPGAQRLKLAVDGLLASLALGRHSCINGGMHRRVSHKAAGDRRWGLPAAVPARPGEDGGKLGRGVPGHRGSARRLNGSSSSKA